MTINEPADQIMFQDIATWHRDIATAAINPLTTVLTNWPKSAMQTNSYVDVPCMNNHV